MFECRDTGASQLPTFRQWSKTADEAHKKPARPVKLIWLPNRFPSFSLETEVFRLRIGEDDPNYSAILSWVEESIEAQRVMVVQPKLDRMYAYSLDILEGEKGIYDPLGDFGFKLLKVERVKGFKKP